MTGIWKIDGVVCDIKAEGFKTEDGDRKTQGLGRELMLI